MFKNIIISLFMSAFLLSAAPLPDTVWKTNVHFTFVSSVRFHPDGSSVASGSYSGPAKLWSATNGVLLRTFSLASVNVAVLAFSPDGTRIFGGSGSGPYRVWQVSNGTTIYGETFMSAGFTAAMYSPSGVFMARGRSQSALSLMDSTNNEAIHLLEGHEGTVSHLTFSPDSTLLGSSGDDNTSRLWRVSDGVMLQNFEDRGGAVAFTPDGKYFCYDNHEDGANFWDVQTNGIARIFPAWGSAVRFTANGKILVTVNGPIINLWRVSTGALLASYDTAPDGSALSLDVSPDARLFAYGTYSGTVVLARLPVFIHTITRTGNETILHWQGGSGLYQLQSNTNFTTNGWQNLGPATTNTVATNLSTTTQFFRVQSLPNP